MDIGYNFLVNALTVIGNGALSQKGKIGLEQGLKSVQPFVQKIWAFIQNRPQAEEIATLKYD